MYKKIFLCICLAFGILLSGCSITNNTNKNHNSENNEYIKAVWITYYELSTLTQNNDEKNFNKEVNKIFKNLKNKGFNRVTVQVRPYADAFYKSDYFPCSSYCFKEQGSDMPYDPLLIMTESAHKYNLSIEAWINPYRVSQDNDFDSLSNDNIAKKWQNTENLLTNMQGIFFNPASDDVTKLIVNGVREIAKNYQVDSICFDDYFYPSTDKSIDKKSYDKYKKSNGDMSLDDWRRDNVNKMVKSVYKTIKNVNSNITFGISPASNIDNNYSSLYANVKLWSTQSGYIDYICPQIYFGFQNESQPFMKTVKLWEQTADCTLYVALPLYKAGKKDEFAGDNGINEFVKNNNIIARQVIYLSKLDKISGYYIFSYSSLKDDDETSNLYSAMQNSSQ